LIAATGARERIAATAAASEQKMCVRGNPRFELPLRLTRSALFQDEVRELAGGIPPVGFQSRVPIAKLWPEHGLTSFCHLVLLTKRAEEGPLARPFEGKGFPASGR
jgi:hypothetical protein